MEEMTNEEFKSLFEMVMMILDGCKTIEEAKEKIGNLTILKNYKEKPGN